MKKKGTTHNRWQKWRQDGANLAKETVKDVLNRLKHAQNALEAVPSDAHTEILSNGKIRKILALFGVNHTPVNAAPRKKSGGRKFVTDDDILAFLKNGQKATKEIKAHFGWSDVTVSVRMKRLKKAGKVSEVENPNDKRSKLWKLV